MGLELNPAHAEDANGWTVNKVNLRAGPGTDYATVGQLATSTPVVLEARNDDMSWALIHVANGGLRGWVSASLLQRAPTFKFSELPVSVETIAGNPAAGNQTSTDPSASQPLPNIPTGAVTSPILPAITPAIRSNIRSIYRRGLRLGNNPRVFSKVGDCHTDHPFFFEIIGNGKYNLGEHVNLQEVIDNFSVPPRPGTGNSFNTRSMAAHSALTSGAVLDWQVTFMFTDQCDPKESALVCEYRKNKPSFAIIMFGVVDVITLTPQQFNYFMRRIVQESINRGVVPILSTSAENPSSPNSGQFNQIVARIAREKRLPLINLQAALDPLPGKGLDADGIHLTRPPSLDDAAVFNGANLQAGYTMRNLVVLQALDIVWRTVRN